MTTAGTRIAVDVGGTLTDVVNTPGEVSKVSIPSCSGSRLDRRVFPPWGVAGGGEGRPFRVTLNPEGYV